MSHGQGDHSLIEKIEQEQKKRKEKRMVDRGILDYAKNVVHVDERILSAAPVEEFQALPEDFSPGSWDVICHGGKESFEHIGNRRFRVCIDNHLETYSTAKSKHTRSSIVTRIVDSIKDCAPEGGIGGFIRKDPKTERWYEVGDKVAREKVGHALRDALKLCQKRKRSDWENAPQSSSDSAEDCSIKDHHSFVRSSTVPKRRFVEVEWAESVQYSTHKCIESDSESDGDSVLNEMAKETVMEEIPLQPASVASLNFNPPGFASFEMEYMKFFKNLAPAFSFQHHPPYLRAVQKRCHKETPLTLQHLVSTAAKDFSPCTIPAMVSQQQAVNNEFSAALSGSPHCFWNHLSPNFQNRRIGPNIVEDSRYF